MSRPYETPSFQDQQVRTCKRGKKMGNHGGSPPNLGLKEATPAPGETRPKWLHTTHSHAMHIHNNIIRFNTIHYNTPHPKALHKDSTIESSIG